MLKSLLSRLVHGPWLRAWLAVLTLQFPATVLLAVGLGEQGADAAVWLADTGEINRVTVPLFSLIVGGLWLAVSLMRWVRAAFDPAEWHLSWRVAGVALIASAGFVVLLVWAAGSGDTRSSNNKAARVWHAHLPTQAI